MTDNVRQLAAEGIRKGLAAWPDANHWCKGRLTDTGPNGERQVCTYQLLQQGIGGNHQMWPRYGTTEYDAVRLAEAEVCLVAKERGMPGTASVCDVNNTVADFDTLKGIVEEAATRLGATVQ